MEIVGVPSTQQKEAERAAAYSLRNHKKKQAEIKRKPGELSILSEEIPKVVNINSKNRNTERAHTSSLLYRDNRHQCDKIKRVETQRKELGISSPYSMQPTSCHAYERARERKRVEHNNTHIVRRQQSIQGHYDRSSLTPFSCMDSEMNTTIPRTSSTRSRHTSENKEVEKIYNTAFIKRDKMEKISINSDTNNNISRNLVPCVSNSKTNTHKNIYNHQYPGKKASYHIYTQKPLIKHPVSHPVLHNNEIQVKPVRHTSLWNNDVLKDALEQRRTTFLSPDTDYIDTSRGTQRSSHKEEQSVPANPIQMSLQVDNIYFDEEKWNLLNQYTKEDVLHEKENISTIPSSKIKYNIYALVKNALKSRSILSMQLKKVEQARLRKERLLQLKLNTRRSNKVGKSSIPVVEQYPLPSKTGVKKLKRKLNMQEHQYLQCTLSSYYGSLTAAQQEEQTVQYRQHLRKQKLQGKRDDKKKQKEKKIELINRAKAQVEQRKEREKRRAGLPKELHKQQQLDEVNNSNNNNNNTADNNHINTTNNSASNNNITPTPPSGLSHALPRKSILSQLHRP